VARRNSVGSARDALDAWERAITYRDIRGQRTGGRLVLLGRVAGISRHNRAGSPRSAASWRHATPAVGAEPAIVVLGMMAAANKRSAHAAHQHDPAR
jgi:hypothetical protein